MKLRSRIIFLSTSENGNSLIELALIAPWIALITLGVVDFGLTLRNKQVVAEGARQAARVAAAHSINNVDCGNEPDDFTLADPPLRFCQEDVSEDAELVIEAVAVTDTVTTAARKAFCAHTSSAGLDTKDWEVIATVQEISPGPTCIRSAVVEITRRSEREECVFCWGNLFEGVRSHTRAVFALDDVCNNQKLQQDCAV